ncbi:MAG: DUF4384 domain-containing protein [bacterium]|nr:DUF4384 domain-containing protein [bacterium]
MKSTGKLQAPTPGTIAFIIMLCLSACAGYQGRRDSGVHSDQPTLELWLEETLVPYLARQLSQHPRFKGQPVLLVRMQGENVPARIDGLTEMIRNKITDGLLKKNGLNLAWRPAIKSWQHHRSLREISCGDDGQARYYIGIDTGLSTVNRKLYVKVKALNPRERKWVSGFGQSWTGMPTPDQLDALGREHPDEYLLGMRPRPFSDGQPDMLAAFLARNLSCLLRQGESDDLIVHVAAPAPNSPPMIKTTLKLLGQYLTRFKEVEVTDDPNRANVTVISALHSIDNDLFQVSISARQRQGEIYLPGAETEAYVMLKAPEETKIAGMIQTEPIAPVQPSYNISAATPIIRSFDLITPLNRRFCAAENPWKSGVQRVASNGLLRTGSCLAIEMEVTKPAYVFLLAQDAAGELSRLYPSSCPAPGPPVTRIHPGERFRFPSLSDPQAAVLEIGGPPGTERVYGLTITAPELATIFSDRMQEFQDPCRPGKKYPEIITAKRRRYPQERIQRWQNDLNWLEKNNPGLVEWRELRFQHREM